MLASRLGYHHSSDGVRLSIDTAPVAVAAVIVVVEMMSARSSWHSVMMLQQQYCSLLALGKGSGLDSRTSVYLAFVVMELRHRLAAVDYY